MADAIRAQRNPAGKAPVKVPVSIRESDRTPHAGTEVAAFLASAFAGTLVLGSLIDVETQSELLLLLCASAAAAFGLERWALGALERRRAAHRARR